MSSNGLVQPTGDLTWIIDDLELLDVVVSLQPTRKSSKDVCDVVCHRTVKKDGDLWDAVLVHYTADEVHHLLGTFNGEHGNHKIASPFERRVGDRF